MKTLLFTIITLLSFNAYAEDFGEYPSNYKQIINDYLRHELKDPDSTKDLTITAPVQRYIRFELNGVLDHYWYKSCVSLNSKNSYGGYTGITTHIMFLRGGRVDQDVPAEALPGEC